MKTYLPVYEKAKSMYSVIFLNSKDINSSIGFMKHKLFDSAHKYLTYYIDCRYRQKIGIKQLNVNLKKRRLAIYEQIEGQFSMFREPLRIEMANNKNMFFDMTIYNELFFQYSKRYPIVKRIDMYFDYIAKVINDSRLDSYKYKTMVIDVQDWYDPSNIINSPVMFIFMALKRYPEKLSKLGDIDIIFYNDTQMFRFNPSKYDKDTFNIFKRLMTILNRNIVKYDDDSVLDKEIKKQELKDDISDELANKFSFTGSLPDEPVEIDDSDDDPDDAFELPKAISNAVADDIDEIIPDVVDSVSSDDADDENNVSDSEIAKKITKDLSDNEKLIADLYDLKQKNAGGRSTASIKRDQELREKQRKIKLKNVDFSTLEKEKSVVPVPSHDISSHIHSTNENVKTVKYANYEKSYNEELMAKDTANIITALNNKSIPVYVIGWDVEDTSDELNYKETYTIQLEDEHRVRHTIKVDMPKFIDDKFLYLNGNRKIIVKQEFMKPISKTGPDEAQICSNYNKIFITRHGAKMSPKIEKLKKTLSADGISLSIKRGDNSAINNPYKTVLEYDELAKTYSSIVSDKFRLIFNQHDIEEELGNRKLGDDEFCIGFTKSKEPIIMSFTDEKIVGTGMDIVEYIIANSPQKVKDVYDKASEGGKRFVYSQATIMRKHVPVIILLGYCEGISTVLKKANIKHYFTDTRPKESENEGVIRFSDGYLVYDKYPFENSLLMNGLSSIPTRSFTYEQFDDKEIYLELFDILYNARNLGNAFDSFYEFMIDPITEEVLETLGYPTDFVSVVLCASALLADNSYITENNMNLYRIRSNEIVNAILHRQLADAYSRYRATSENKHPVKISIPRDAVIKQLLLSTTVEEFSTLNPIYEMEKLRAITPKGLQGLNIPDAYTQDKRSYDNTMLGIMGISTSPDGNVGVVRQLTLEPSIKSPRGYIDIHDDDVQNLKDVNIFTPAELLTPIGVTRDDSIRTAMASKQSKHIIPVEKSSPVLISNGVEQSVQYYLSKDFIIRADDDGEVVENDPDTGLIIVKYKNGKSQAIDVKPKVVKNSASGFYISNKMNCDLKVGDKVKKDDILAYEDKFFTQESLNGNRFNIGSLQKIAVMSSYSTYEDSTFITKKMSEEMASDIIMMKDAIIGKNANVDHMVHIGDRVNVGDALISFETSYDEASMNKFLASVGDELQEEIKSLGKIPVKTKYAGVIEDIKIYSSVDIDELSPSLQKIVSNYYRGIKKKKKLLEKYDDSKSIVKAGILFNEPTGKIEPSSDGKLKGKEVFDGVLIEFYVKYRDPIGVGDKVTFFSALKSIVGEVVEEGYEPFSEYRPDEEVSSFIGPSAILQRMTPSILLTMFGNKVLIELKRELEEIYNSD